MSTYLSHPVRRIRDKPTADESIRLVVELDDIDSEELSTTVSALSGTIERELQFDCYLIEIPEMAVENLCELVGLTRIETADTIAVAPPETDLPTEPADEEAEPETER